MDGGGTGRFNRDVPQVVSNIAHPYSLAAEGVNRTPIPTTPRFLQHPFESAMRPCLALRERFGLSTCPHNHNRHRHCHRRRRRRLQKHIVDSGVSSAWWGSWISFLRLEDIDSDRGPNPFREPENNTVGWDKDQASPLRSLDIISALT